MAKNTAEQEAKTALAALAGAKAEVAEAAAAAMEAESEVADLTATLEATMKVRVG